MTLRRPRLHRAARWGLAVLLTAAASLATAQPAEADYVRNLQWYLGALGFTAAHKVTTGQGVKVCVVDTGIDGTLPDLAGAVVAGKDFSGQHSPDGRPVDAEDAHGTSVASLLAGRGNLAGHKSGVLGAAPGASLLAARVASTRSASAQFVSAIHWCISEGASVLNFSSDTGSPQVTAAISYAQAHDAVIVAATGDSPGTSLPIGPIAALPGVVAVSGIDANRKIDPQSTTGAGVTIAAPYATKAGFSQNSKNGIPAANMRGFGGTPYGYFAGTSAATPIVAGTVALIRQRFPQLNAQQVIQQLENTATRTGGGPYPNDVYGYGIVNADKAVTDLTVKPTPTTSTPTTSTTPSTTAPATSSAPTSSPASASASPTAAASGGSGGSNTGLIIGIIAAVVVIIALVVGLLIRRRRGGPPPPGPGGPTGWTPPPPGYPG